MLNLCKSVLQQSVDQYFVRVSLLLERAPIAFSTFFFRILKLRFEARLNAYGSLKQKC